MAHSGHDEAEPGLARRTLRLLHTVRYLRREQIVGRAVHRLHRPRIDASAAPKPRDAVAAWHVPVTKQRCLFDDARSARFLNVTQPIGGAEAWNDPGRAKLWLYNLHYFDDLGGPATNPDAQRAFMRRWMAENPPGKGNGWEPYPTSLRIVNWIKWALAGHTLESDTLHSLAVQTRWLAGRLEWHLLGNHLLANAKAMLFAGLFFSGDEAERWFETGRRIYARELGEQILGDGGHFELSPMYHTIILEDLLDVLNIVRAYCRDGAGGLSVLPELTTSMRYWLSAMTHPDGGPSFFNDTTTDIAATRADLEAYAFRLGLPAAALVGVGVHHLAASGYVRVNLGTAAAILDVAAIGPQYLPGHAHADTLSFELSVAGERIIVNSGTSTYTPGPQRRAERATRAHSTVEVDGRNSSDVWGAFRVGQRARVSDVSIRETSDGVEVSAVHDGYQTRFGGPLHRRQWHIGSQHLTVTDRMIGGAFTSAVARLYLPPQHLPQVISPKQLTLTGAGPVVTVTSEHAISIMPCAWHRAFGLSEPAHVCATVLVDGRATVSLDWV